VRLESLHAIAVVVERGQTAEKLLPVQHAPLLLVVQVKDVFELCDLLVAYEFHVRRQSAAPPPLSGAPRPLVSALQGRLLVAAQVLVEEGVSGQRTGIGLGSFLVFLVVFLLVHPLEHDVVELNPSDDLLDVLFLEAGHQRLDHVQEGNGPTAFLVEVLEQTDRYELQRLVLLTRLHVV